MDYTARVSKAVKHFWQKRAQQSRAQGSKTGRADRGGRKGATGGAQLDGFISLFADILKEAGLPDHTIFSQPVCPPACKPSRASILPGYFRPEKNWDLVVVADDRLLAAVEFKSQTAPSFGNNFNNRVEEALGNASGLHP